jgi:hypothetical protein
MLHEVGDQDKTMTWLQLSPHFFYHMLAAGHTMQMDEFVR